MFIKELKINDKVKRIVKKLLVGNYIIIDKMKDNEYTNKLIIRRSSGKYNLEIVDKLSKSLDGLIDKRNSYFNDNGELELDFNYRNYKEDDKKNIKPYGYEYDFNYLENYLVDKCKEKEKE